MVWVNIIAILILFLSFLGGLKEGLVKNVFSLLSLFIAISITGIFYRLLAIIISFLPGSNWENFIGFFLTMGVISIILYFVFIIPRKLLEKIFGLGPPGRFIGGLLNLFNTSIGIVLFALVLSAYPIFGWLERAVSGSGVIIWLVQHLSFVQSMLPEAFRQAATFNAMII